MSAEPELILEVIPPGDGIALDLGGGRGGLRQPLEKLGYRYLNLDIQRFNGGNPDLIGDAHQLPFKNSLFQVVISKDTLEHFAEPWKVVQEVHRVLKDGGYFVVWVPFMHPFHGDDFYRYTPLGLQHLLKDFEIVFFDSPRQVFTVIGLAVIELLKRMRLGFFERITKGICYKFDQWFMQGKSRPASFANSYRVVAKKMSRQGPCKLAARLAGNIECKEDFNDSSIIDPELLRIMCCPKCRGDLFLAEDGKGLDCLGCRLRYPIEEGIPIMLIDRALPLEGKVGQR